MKSTSSESDFRRCLVEGIPDELPPLPPPASDIDHAPARRQVLTPAEKKLALANALRYFPPRHHTVLAPEFAEELERDGRIYMRRMRPTEYEMQGRPIDAYPAKTPQAAAIMLMIQNNLDEAVAQHPHELITYGGNGTVFQNWAQYRLTMQYLSEMTDDQTLVLYSGHPLGLFPSHPDAPRLVLTCGMVVPNYSSARRLHAPRRPRRDLVRPDDGGQLHVHRSPGHRPRHDDHVAQRRPQVSPVRPRRRVSPAASTSPPVSAG